MMNWGEQYSELNNTTEIKRLSLKKAQNANMIGYDFCRRL